MLFPEDTSLTPKLYGNQSDSTYEVKTSPVIKFRQNLKNVRAFVGQFRVGNTLPLSEQSHQLPLGYIINIPPSNQSSLKFIDHDIRYSKAYSYAKVVITDTPLEETEFDSIPSDTKVYYRTSFHCNFRCTSYMLEATYHSNYMYVRNRTQLNTLKEAIEGDEAVYLNVLFAKSIYRDLPSEEDSPDFAFAYNRELNEAPLSFNELDSIELPFIQTSDKFRDWGGRDAFTVEYTPGNFTLHSATLNLTSTKPYVTNTAKLLSFALNGQLPGSFTIPAFDFTEVNRRFITLNMYGEITLGTNTVNLEFTTLACTNVTLQCPSYQAHY